MRQFIFIALVSAIGSAAFSQTVSDESMADCNAQDLHFTKLAGCLHSAEVAKQMLSFIQREEVFSSMGEELAHQCNIRNETLAGSWACANKAIEDAVALLELVGSTDRIDDPLASALADPQKLELVSAEVSSLRRAVPGEGSGTSYRPLSFPPLN